MDADCAATPAAIAVRSLKPALFGYFVETRASRVHLLWGNVKRKWRTGSRVHPESRPYRPKRESDSVLLGLILSVQVATRVSPNARQTGLTAGDVLVGLDYEPAPLGVRTRRGSYLHVLSPSLDALHGRDNNRHRHRHRVHRPRSRLHASLVTGPVMASSY